MPLTADALSEIKVIDTDTHVCEPPDLWVSRVAKKWQSDVPHVEFNKDTGHTHWRTGNRWLTPVGFYGQAGWGEYPPSRAWEMDEMDPAAWQARARIKKMDEYGLHAQVLYPNVVGFEAPVFMDLGPELSVVCVKAYNDFIHEWASEAPGRLIPVAMLPFWDLEASVAEMRRWRDMGHTAVLFANKMEEIGYPPFYDVYWDPILSTAQELGISLNFHIGFANHREGMTAAIFGSQGQIQKGGRTPVAADADRSVRQLIHEDRSFDARAQVARVSALTMSLTNAISQIVTCGVCDRFPELKFVSVESGFGWIPYLLESLDWHFLNYGLARGNKMLPSDYFRRQCYGSFWFEKTTLPLLDVYPDNFMFETDFPHHTSLSPGKASVADIPSVHIAKAFKKVPAAVARKALYSNAAEVYRVDLGL